MIRGLVLVVALAVSCVTANAGTIYVPAEYATIQEAINVAQPFDTIVVAPGTYNETINFLGKAITVRSSDGRDVTRIDATGLGGSVVTFANGEGLATVLQGFTIKGGTGTDVGGYRFGGGVFSYKSSPTVSDCTFSGNYANLGGAVFNQSSTSRVINCTFDTNTADNGGGMYNYRDNSTITACIFIGNTANSGGGMFNVTNAPLISECIFVENHAGSGGGIYNYFAMPVLEDNKFVKNRAFIDPFSGAGGAIADIGSDATLIRCQFTGNQSADGGAMYVSGANHLLVHCTFRGNAADVGGAFYSAYGGQSHLSNCVFEGNLAAIAGGGLVNSASNLTIADCLLVGNRQAASRVSGLGGGVFGFLGSTTAVTGCTLSGNIADAGSGMAIEDSDLTVTNCILWGNGLDEVVSLNTSSLVLLFSDMQGGLPVGAIDGGGNIDLDPMFVRSPDPGSDGTWDGVNDDYGDLRLRGGSPCINEGDPSFVAQPAETDLDGHARVLCGRVEMGAYEFGFGDFNCDLSLTLLDFASWDACMLGPDNGPLGAGCEAFDGNADLDVDLRDFADFQNNMIDP